MKEKSIKPSNFQLPELMRKCFRNRSLSNNDWEKLYGELTGLCRSYCTDRGYAFDNDKIGEIVQLFSIEIFEKASKIKVEKSAEENEESDAHEPEDENFWETIDSKSDGEIVNYLKKMIRTTVRKSFNDPREKSRMKVYNDVDKKIKELVNEQMLRNMGNEFYALAHVRECLTYFELSGSVVFPKVNLWRGEKETNLKRLKEYILEIVSIVGEKCISRADILEVVENNSNLSRISTHQISRTDFIPEGEEESELIISGDANAGSIDRDVLKRSLQRFENDYENPKRIHAAVMFILNRMYGLTLNEILSFLTQNCTWKKTSPETVRTWLEDVNESLGLKDLDEDEKYFFNYVEAIVSEMKKRYLPPEVLKEIDKLF